MPRYLGVDLGTRRIGVAISDPKATLAVPYATLQRSNDEYDAVAIVEIARGESVREIILGHPLTLDGTRGDAALVAEAFRDKLKAAGGRVRLLDERLTTKEASKMLSSRGMKQREQRKLIDKAAATVLLQSFLDSRKKH